MTYWRGKCVEQGSTQAWSKNIEKCIVYVNIKPQKKYGYPLSEQILESNLQMKYFDGKCKFFIKAEVEIEDLTKW